MTCPHQPGRIIKLRSVYQSYTMFSLVFYQPLTVKRIQMIFNLLQLYALFSAINSPAVRLYDAALHKTKYLFRAYKFGEVQALKCPFET